MLKAFKEIGFRQALKFSFTTLFLVVFNNLLFPQLRSLFLQIIGARVGKDTVVHEVTFFNCYKTGFKGLQLGDDCFIGNDSLIDLADQVIILDQVTLAERVTILTHTNIGYKDHPLQKYYPSFNKPVVIKNGSFIGVNATIMPGVTIGPCSIIAAGSVVTRTVEPFTVVGGVPARVLKTLSHEDDGLPDGLLNNINSPV
jgi:maltose O-acetyltransferase